MDIAFHIVWWWPVLALAIIGFICFAAIGGEPFGNPGYEVEKAAIGAGLYFWVPAFCIWLGHALT